MSYVQLKTTDGNKPLFQHFLSVKRDVELNVAFWGK
jgi:hypothetical protein